MLILRDILNECISLAEAPMSDKEFIKSFNRARGDLAMLYDTAKKRQPQVIICTDITVENELTVGTLKIERVLDSYGNYCKGFKIRGNSKIIFDNTGTFTIQAMFLPDPILTMDGVLDIESAYIGATTKFIVARILKKIDPAESQKYMQEFYSDAALTNGNIRKAINPNRTVRANRYR